MKKNNGIMDLGILKLNEAENSETYYVTIIDSYYINVSSDYLAVALTGDKVGKIKVYHDGLYFGTIEQMEYWIKESIINHLTDNGTIVQDGETVMGEKLWKWS